MASVPDTIITLQKELEDYKNNGILNIPHSESMIKIDTWVATLSIMELSAVERDVPEQFNGIIKVISKRLNHLKQGLTNKLTDINKRIKFPHSIFKLIERLKHYSTMTNRPRIPIQMIPVQQAIIIPDSEEPKRKKQKLIEQVVKGYLDNNSREALKLMLDSINENF